MLQLQQAWQADEVGKEPAGDGGGGAEREAHHRRAAGHSASSHGAAQAPAGGGVGTCSLGAELPGIGSV